MPRLLLRDDQWLRIEPMLHGKAVDRGRSGADDRLFVEAVFWMARTGSPWPYLPAHFGPWNTAFRRFARWADKGVWKTIFARLSEDADFEEVFLNSTIIRVHQHAAGVSKKRTTRPWPFSWGMEHQDPRLGGWPRKPGAVSSLQGTAT